MIHKDSRRQLDGIDVQLALLVMEEFEAETGSRPSHDNDDILALLRSIYLDMIRQNARKHAMDLAAA